MIIEQFNRTKTAVITNFHNICFFAYYLHASLAHPIHLRNIIAELTNQLLNEVIGRAFENSIYF